MTLAMPSILHCIFTELGVDIEEINDSPLEVVNQWWSEYVTDEDLEDYRKGPKLMLLFAILRQCELIGDKVWVSVL
jgi:transcriptional regulator ATRX